jgi:hypothetical protein
VVRAIDGRTSVREIVARLLDAHEPALLYHTLMKLHSAGFFEEVPGPGRIRQLSRAALTLPENAA